MIRRLESSVDVATTARLRLRFVRSRPFPIPPEPARTPAVELMRRAVIDADEHEGRPGPFLRAMEALGIGFDS